MKVLNPHIVVNIGSLIHSFKELSKPHSPLITYSNINKQTLYKQLRDTASNITFANWFYPETYNFQHVEAEPLYL